jgi:hypothetical protein
MDVCICIYIYVVLCDELITRPKESRSEVLTAVKTPAIQVPASPHNVSALRTIVGWFRTLDCGWSVVKFTTLFQ